MTVCRIVVSLLLPAAVAGGACAVLSAQPPLPSLPASAPAAEEFEVYTRGALHEAFATPASNDVVVPPMVAKAPPELIEELPPEQQPEGDNVTWISGYWSWDEELEDYIWISGLWRDVPPGRQWVPGYWAQTPDGYQWVAGMWVDNGSSTLVYLPTPPASVERGPSIEAPGPDYFYVPGCYEYRDARYLWRTGYWAPRQRDWIWVPAHYVHTPYGCCFVAGHWDYALIDRGLCYAPVRFHHHHVRPVVAYRPAIVIDTWGDSLAMHLWVDQRRGCFTYGNYYETRHAHYVPWYEHRGRWGGRDPLFTYYEWRNGPDYRHRLSGWHDHFVSHRDWRPPATYREQARYVETRRASNVNINLRVAVDITKINRDRDGDRDRSIQLPVNLKTVSRDDEHRYREQSKGWIAASQQRRQFEANAEARGDRPGRPGEQPGKGQPPRQLKLEMPKTVAAVERKEVQRPETPDKLKNVTPDKPRGEVARVPSHARERKPVAAGTEQGAGREAGAGKDERADVRPSADLPPPPPGRDRDAQSASKEDRKKDPKEVRDAFGLGDDGPGRGDREKGRGEMPDRNPPAGRAQTDGEKPGRTPAKESPSKASPADGLPVPRRVEPREGAPRPDAARSGADGGKPAGNPNRPEMRRSEDAPSGSKPERPESRPEKGDRPQKSDEPDAGKRPEPGTRPRPGSEPSEKAPARTMAPRPERSEGAAGRSSTESRRMENASPRPGAPETSTRPGTDRRPQRTETPTEPRRTENTPAGNPPSGNRPQAGSTSPRESRRGGQTRPNTPSAKPGDARSERSKATAPDRSKGTKPSDEKRRDRDKEKDQEKDKEKETPKAP
ncbi:hypothetical protein Pan44_09360 [Caulifigura coniformis]|uniref:Uncharacterized protein n=1 Tax=Caulifigura coniformis TaxID=2527983 RepID=A0A517S9X8_9PLAN|nr:hypothetical protein [Caulifigura coniformis]QDT52923.1 hypothetical protein Pan44_09360 [Caulifigura coniformis]